MSVEEKVIRDANKFMRMFQGLAALAGTEFANIGTLKDAAAEAQAALDGVNREIEAANATLAIAQQGVADAVKDADGTRAKATADAAGVRTRAEDYALKQVGEGDAIIAAARSQGGDIITAAHVEAQQLRAALESLHADIEAANRARETAKAEAQKAAQALAAVRAEAKKLSETLQR